MVTSTSGGRSRGDRGVALVNYILAIVAVACLCLAVVTALGGDVGAIHDSNGQAITAALR